MRRWLGSLLLTLLKGVRLHDVVVSGRGLRLVGSSGIWSTEGVLRGRGDGLAEVCRGVQIRRIEGHYLVARLFGGCLLEALTLSAASRGEVQGVEAWRPPHVPAARAAPSSWMQCGKAPSAALEFGI